MTVQFRCKDALLKDCDLEIRGVHSTEQMMDLVELHAKEAHPLIKLSPETREKIRHAIKSN